MLTGTRFVSNFLLSDEYMLLRIENHTGTQSRTSINGDVKKTHRIFIKAHLISRFISLNVYFQNHKSMFNWECWDQLQCLWKKRKYMYYAYVLVISSHGIGLLFTELTNSVNRSDSMNINETRRWEKIPNSWTTVLSTTMALYYAFLQ